MNKKEDYIGIFDSGMGGLSVLKEMMKEMPNENFIYYGDSKNAPYGTKTKQEVEDLSIDVCEYLIHKGVKAIVVACNTATSAAIVTLRNKYEVPIIGMEPALKPAVMENRGGRVAVMATEMTLSEKKFEKLMNAYSADSEIIKMPCPNLVEIVEQGIVEGPRAEEEIIKCFEGHDLNAIDAIVLGCTHFIFLKESIEKLVGETTKLYDGNSGTAKYLKRILKERALLNDEKEPSKVIIHNSCSDEYVQRSKDLIQL